MKIGIVAILFFYLGVKMAPFIGTWDYKKPLQTQKTETKKLIQEIYMSNGSYVVSSNYWRDGDIVFNSVKWAASKTDAETIAFSEKLKCIEFSKEMFNDTIGIR